MNLPLVVWLLRDHLRDLPVGLEEASMVDGSTRLGAFFRVAPPLTPPVQIAGNVTTTGPRCWDIAAQGLVVMVPPLLVALLAGRSIVRGLMLGAVKR